jgi:hypothetical protein
VGRTRPGSIYGKRSRPRESGAFSALLQLHFLIDHRSAPIEEAQQIFSEFFR